MFVEGASRPMRAWWLLPLTLALTLAGCTGESPSSTALPAEPATVEDPWMGADRVSVLDWHAGTQEFDALCLMGGAAFELERSGPVLPGTHHLEVTVATEGTFTGLQVGHSVDNGDTIRWLPTVRDGPETFEVAVSDGEWEPPADFEQGDDVWSFHHQMNLPEPATQDCYTGYGDGEWHIVVEAVKGA